MTVVSVYKARPPAYAPAPSVSIRFRLLRDGEVTGGEKFLRLFKSIDAQLAPDLVFWAEPEDGEYTSATVVNLAVLQSASWFALGRDDALPMRVRASYLAISAGGTYIFNITSGEGGGTVGTPGTVTGVVRADGVPADRQIVVIERPANGEWRLAGFAPTPGGSGEINVRVTDGVVYAVALDDWGIMFTADLAVQIGQTVRPTNFTGWLYRITQAGALPSAEPQWWAAQGDNPSRALGTARAVAVRYHQPLAHGPLPVEIT